MENKEKILSVVGKNYDQITEINKKITSLAVGQNHFVFLNFKQEVYGFGSNKFGQLGIKQNQTFFYKNAVRLFQSIQVKNVFCGSEHTFIINDDKQTKTKFLVVDQILKVNQVSEHSKTVINLNQQLVYYLMDLKIPKLIILRWLKIPPLRQFKHCRVNIDLYDVLEFDLQVKMQQQSIQKKYALSKDEYIIQISCGALFTIALSNQGNIYGCGYQGLKNFVNHQDQLQKCRFKKIQVQQKIYRITSGLSGSVAISKDNKFFIWGKFGKHNINFPKRINKDFIDKQLSFIDCKLGDQFGVFLTSKGQVYTFGQNFDNQLGTQQSTQPYRQKLQKVEKIPLMSQIFVGRNTVFCLSLQKNQLFSWGSNRYGQLLAGNTYQLESLPSSCNILLQENDSVVPSSYCTFLLSKKTINQPQKKKKMQNKFTNDKQQQMIPVSQYIKIMEQYKALKALNMTLLEKIQPTVKKSTQQSQTYFKLQLEGVTQYRKFNSNIQVKWNQLQLESQINQGGFGLIYKAKWRQITVIVKKFKIQNGDVSIRDFLSQCHAMEAVRHPHIVMFLGAVTSSPHYSIILEYCSKGSLWSYLQNLQNSISWQQKRRFAMEIAQGVLYLHLCSPPILHRDLKSLNIFIDGNLKIKIGDFGWTKTLQNYMTNKIGTYQWMAPQVIGNKPYTQKADVFSFSIIMWEIASREPPYKNISGTKVSQDVLHRQLRPPVPKKTPQGWTKLMKRCWDKDPNKRPDFAQIIRQLQVMKL